MVTIKQIIGFGKTTHKIHNIERLLTYGEERRIVLLCYRVL